MPSRLDISKELLSLLRQFQIDLAARLTDDEVIAKYHQILEKSPAHRAYIISVLDSDSLKTIGRLRPHAFKSSTQALRDYTYLLRNSRWRLQFQQLDIAFGPSDWARSSFLRALREIDKCTNAEFNDIATQINEERRSSRSKEHKPKHVLNVLHRLRAEAAETPANNSIGEESPPSDTLSSPLSSPQSASTFSTTGHCPSVGESSLTNREQVNVLASSAYITHANAMDLPTVSGNLTYDMGADSRSATLSPPPEPTIHYSTEEPSKSVDTLSNRLRQPTTDTAIIATDLLPGHRLTADTVDALLKTFLPRSILRIVEPANPTNIRKNVAASLKHGLVSGTHVLTNICANSRWLGILYDGKRKTTTVLNSLSGTVSAKDSGKWIDEAAQGIRDAGLANATTSTTNVPQQDKDYDCGLYLVVSVMRYVATSHNAPNSSNAKSGMEPIDGLFYQALFTHFFRNDNAIAKEMLTSLTGLEVEHEGTDAVSHIRHARTNLQKLETCYASAQSALVLFVALGNALTRASKRLETGLTTIRAIGMLYQPTSYQTVVQYVPNVTPVYVKALCLATHNLMTSAEQHADHDLSLTQEASSSIHRIIALVASLLTVLDQELARARIVVQQRTDEARATIETKRKRIEELYLEIQELERKSKKSKKYQEDKETEVKTLERLITS